MKIFIILSFLVCFVVRISIAQATFSDSLGDQIRHIFVNVDKSAVSSGYLEEYGATFSHFLHLMVC